jgi:hypothetical protein
MGKGTANEIWSNYRERRELKVIFAWLLVTVAIGGLFPSLGLADFPAGQWTVSSYSEVGYGAGTDGICFQNGETPTKGTWYSDTFPGRAGKWFRKGNAIHLQGNYSGGAGNVSFELTLITYKLLTGYTQEWKDNNIDNNFSRVQFVFQKTTCNPSR